MSYARLRSPVSVSWPRLRATAANCWGNGHGRKASEPETRRSTMSFWRSLNRCLGHERTRRISGGDERTNHDERQRGAVWCIRWFAGELSGHSGQLPAWLNGRAAW